MAESIFAAIEAGGTKFNLAVGCDFDNCLSQTRISTTDPQATLSECRDFFEKAEKNFGSIQALGIASFGPINLRQGSDRYGYILNTPKPGWSDLDLAGFFDKALNCPVALDTDVNAAALAEHKATGEKGNLAYITVGTGVGVGVCLNGRTLKGQLHPELGHLFAQPLPNEPPGVCPYHGDCVEGLISGPALNERWQCNIEYTAEDHPLWLASATHLARLCIAITLAYSPYQIVIGGGVASNKNLLELTQKSFEQQMANYLPVEAYPAGIQNFITAPKLLGLSGLAGAFFMAKQKFNDNKNN